MEEKVIKRSPKKIIWNALFGFFSAFLLVISLLFPLAFTKGNQISYDKSFVNAGFTFLCWSRSLSDLQTFKLG